MTPICHEPTPLPDPHGQTEMLRAVLEQAAERLEASSAPDAPAAASDLRAMREALSDPPEANPGLDTLDNALADAIRSIPALTACAGPPEVQQSLKTLRRILLIDRRRVDPDPECCSFTLAVALRRLWLISHRSGLLRGQKQLAGVLQRLSVPDLPEEEEKKLQETRAVLEEYIAAQEGYGASVRQELEALNAQRLT